ncbi:MAG: DUF2478 domain-containing protein [Pseudomonadota bacterium]
MLNRRGATDLLMSSLVAPLTAQGLRLCGCVQENVERPGAAKCDMLVRTLPKGRSYQISQSLGAGARGCRLDAGALEQAVADVADGLRGGADLVIINKFGKHEAAGRGFCGVIGEAMAAGIPVLVGLNQLNHNAFLDFSDGMAEPVEADLESLLAWVERSVGGSAV